MSDHSGKPVQHVFSSGRLKGSVMPEELETHIPDWDPDDFRHSEQLYTVTAPTIGVLLAVTGRDAVCAGAGGIPLGDCGT